MISGSVGECGCDQCRCEGTCICVGDKYSMCAFYVAFISVARYQVSVLHVQ